MTINNLDMIDALQQAIEEQALDVVYQPKINMQTETIIGLEALVRWHQKDGSTIPPAVFIPQAEEAGVITPLTLYVMERVCQCLHRWRARGIPIVPISINVSRKDLSLADFPYQVISLLKKYHIESRYIELEITETAFVQECKDIAEKIEILRIYGIQIAIDDFGTGYSSLSCLRILPIDILKIDRVFLQDIVTDQLNQSILKGILELAQILHLTVVYEGIETKEQVEYLKCYEHKIAQGFYYSGAMSKKEMERCLSWKEASFPQVLNDNRQQPLLHTH